MDDVVIPILIRGQWSVSDPPRVVASTCSDVKPMLTLLDERYRVFDDSCVICREVKVLAGELVNYRIDFHNGSIDAMSKKGTRCGAYAETTGKQKWLEHRIM